MTSFHALASLGVLQMDRLQGHEVSTLVVPVNSAVQALPHKPFVPRPLPFPIRLQNTARNLSR